jgi:hypothetical protein
MRLERKHRWLRVPAGGGLVALGILYGLYAWERFQYMTWENGLQPNWFAFAYVLLGIASIVVGPFVVAFVRLALFVGLAIAVVWLAAPVWVIVDELLNPTEWGGLTLMIGALATILPLSVVGLLVMLIVRSGPCPWGEPVPRD